MKTIYINREAKPKRKLGLILGIVVLFVITLRLAAPYVIKSAINKSGADERGYAYKVSDVGLSLLKAQMRISELEVFHVKSKVVFASAEELLMDMDPTQLLRESKLFSITGGHLDLTISKDFFEEINRVKNEAKDKADADVYIDRVVAHLDSIDLKEIKEGETRTLLSLKNTNAEVKDLGLGSINERTEFKVDSDITEGGQVSLQGKTRLEADQTPWVISGKLKKIPSAVLEKLAADRLPINIESANIDADISAHSEGGQIEGEIVPDIKDLKLSENKEEGTLKRNVAKAVNYLFDKSKGKDEKVSFTLPFTLNQNFTINMADTIDKIKNQ